MENEEIYLEFSEPIEEVTEQINDVDSGPDNSDIVIDDSIISEDLVDDSLETLLKEYIKSTLESDVGEDQEEDIPEEEKEIVEEKEEEVIDYTEILQNISDRSDIINDTQEQILLRGLEYDENNVLSADINDISLTNFLLILLFISILFTGVINFSRRLF